MKLSYDHSIPVWFRLKWAIGVIVFELAAALVMPVIKDRYDVYSDWSYWGFVGLLLFAVGVIVFFWNAPMMYKFKKDRKDHS